MDELYLRGDIVWVQNEFDFTTCIQSGKRPYLIISNNTNNEYSTTLTAIPLTTRIKRYMPTHHTIFVNGNRNTVLAEQITCISKKDILEYIDTIEDNDLKKIEEKIKIQLGLKGE